MSQISKKNHFNFTDRQIAAGKQMWDRTGKSGRLSNSSMDAEATAPKTWILFKNSHRGEQEAVIECEIYMQGRASDPGEAVGMLHGMCPKCGETFLVREDNKGMSLDWVTFPKSRGHLREQWTRHCRESLRRQPREDDKIAVVSSPERWQCDYCKSWCVKVTDSIAITDMSGATQIIMDVGQRTDDNGKIVPAVTIKESEVLL